MRKKLLLLTIIVLSCIFNIGFAIFIESASQPVRWFTPELGPAIMQDSYYVRAPGLESPFGIIGDIPGGYSLYSGNPLQSGQLNNSTEVYATLNWFTAQAGIELSMLLLSLLIGVIPLLVILLVGRRSYGSTKTQ